MSETTTLAPHERFRALREALGMLKPEAGALFGRSRQAIRQWEAGVQTSEEVPIADAVAVLEGKVRELCDEISERLKHVGGPLTPPSLRQWRELAGLSREALADRLDVRAVTVYRWETGATAIQEMDRVAAALVEALFERRNTLRRALKGE